MGSQKSPLRKTWLFLVFIVFMAGFTVFIYYTEWFKFSRDYEAVLTKSEGYSKSGYKPQVVPTEERLPLWRRLKAKRVSMIPVKSQHWQQVGISKNLYVFSAYYMEEENIVQIIGIAPIRTKVKSFTCIFAGTNSTTQTTVQGVMEILPEHHSKRYGAVFIRCPLKNVAEPFSVGIMVDKSTTSLRVIYPGPRRYQFTVCVPSLHGPFSDPLRIIELVETDMLFGADHFIVYNHSITPAVDRVLRHYVKLRKMEVIQWNLLQDDVWYWGQLASLQDCTFASRRQSKYLVLKDADEFIVPHTHENWHELMNELNKGKSKIGSYIFHNTFFNLKLKTDNTTFKGAPAAKMYKIRNQLYVWRDANLESKVRCKSIVHPERVVTSGIHLPWKLVNGYTHQDVNPKTAFMHHYRNWEGGGGQVKDDFMRVFADELLRNVNQTLSELGAEVKSWLVR